MPQRRTQAHPRNRGRLTARFGVDGLDRTGFTTNLSLGGAYLHTKHVYKPGTVIRVEFTDRNAKASLKAVVIWAEEVPAQLAHLLPCGMGLRFIDPDMKWKEFYLNWRGAGVALAGTK